MKNRLIKLGMLLAVLAFVSTEVDAQAKKPVREKSTRTTTAKKTNSNRTQAAANPAAIAPAPDTVKPVVAAPPEADLNIPPLKPSLRNDNAIERNLVKERTPLAYEHIREDDAVYVQRVWREIDVHEKMNLPFVYKADGDLGNQRFIMILLNAIKNDSITAFAPLDDRFTTPITFKEIATALVGVPRVIQIPDLVNDSDGSKGLMKDTTIIDEFDPDKSVERYWIKEDVIFDKESSRLFTRILGIAPLKSIYNEDGSFRDVTPLFWVYYPDLRTTFAKYEVYNGRNFGGKVSWEELFESRMFSSRIIKSTINNPNDLFIKSYVKDPILALLEGENVKEKIFNYEQDLWSY